MRKFLAGVATIVLAASMAQAQPGKDKGNGGPKEDRGAAVEAKGGKNAKGGKSDARAERGAERRMGPAKRNEDRGEPPRRQAGQSDNRAKAAARQVERRNDGGNRASERRGNGGERGARIVDRIDDRGDRFDRRTDRDLRFGFDRSRGLVEGCPPGLAKKNNGCMPPGLARARDRSVRDIRFRDAFYQPEWWGYDGIDGRVFYDDGYLYRLGSDNMVRGFLPLLGGALSVGSPWPSYYDPVRVPDYYVDYYNLGPSGSYRYADDALFRLDPETSAITAIAALLTGDEIQVGQPMPVGYDVYNVPYAYRDRYYDTPDARYRYADGYVYRIDPETQLVAAAIQLLV